MDFIGVALAGMGEPLARILLEEVEEQGGWPQASMFRTGKKASLSQAALANGTAGHALDYDDVDSGCNGHPTAPVAPAVMALAEHMGSSGRDVIRALASGIDAECLAALVLLEFGLGEPAKPRPLLVQECPRERLDLVRADLRRLHDAGDPRASSR